jgi:hypothetical protein
MTYGCHNRPPFKRSHFVQDGWWADGVQRIPKLSTAPFRMAEDCQYTLTDLGQADERCQGCKHRKDVQ